MSSIVGQINRVIYESNGFVILRINAKGRPISDGDSFDWDAAQSSGHTELCITGNMLHPALGVDYTFSGDLQLHAKYGMQLAFKEYSRHRPVSEKSVMDYLILNCPGVGVRKAERIFALYGDNAIEKLKTDPVMVAASTGLSVEHAIEASKRLSDIEDSEVLKLQLATLLAGTSANKGHINSIIRKYGYKGPDIVSNTPYQLLDVSGIGFKIADSIAVKNGVDLKSPERISACANYVCINWENHTGHTCISKKYLVERIKEETNLEIELIIECMAEHVKSGLFIVFGEHIYRRDMYQTEKNIAIILSKLAQSPVEPVTPVLTDLDEDQIEAVHMAIDNAVCMLTGPPGTGKSHTIRRMCDSFEGMSVALAAQTGKAARRMEELTGRASTTIHSLLLPKSITGDDEDGDVRFQFHFNARNQLEIDVLIVDESSLLDVHLAQSLFCAVRMGTRVIIVGDPYQLPSVGPGKILDSLIESNEIAHISLTQIKRQGLNSEIVKTCHAIKDNTDPEIKNVAGGDLFHFQTRSDEETIAQVLDLFSDRIPSKMGFAIDDIQIVTPNKDPKQAISTYKINNEIQKRISTGFEIQGSEKIIDRETKAKIKFRLGDRVINTKNLKDVDIYTGDDYLYGKDTIVNGDIGVIIGVIWRRTFYDQAFLETVNESSRDEVLSSSGKDISIVVKFQKVNAILSVKKNFIDLAYAVTCHKYQGSESPVVIIPIPRGNNVLMNKSWVYTALSRGKKLVAVVGPRDSWSFACITPNRRRDSFLAHFIRDEMRKMLEQKSSPESGLTVEPAPATPAAPASPGSPFNCPSCERNERGRASGYSNRAARIPCVLCNGTGRAPGTLAPVTDKNFNPFECDPIDGPLF